MKFSILVPVYNVEKYLRQCLDSILSQTFTDYEVILVNDGSTDGSAKICDEYLEKHTDKICVFHKQNQGLLLTRRFSLKQAKGEYIVFVDSDDYVAGNLLEILKENFDRHACDMLLYSFVRFVEGEAEVSYPTIPFADGTVFEGETKRQLYESFVLKHTFSNMWVKAVRREIIDVNTDYLSWNVSRSEDVIQTPPLFNNANKIVFIDQALYYYRKSLGSTTARISEKDCRNYLIVTKRISEYLKIWSLSEKVGFGFTVERISFFYTYLRDIARKANKEKSKTLLLNTVQLLGGSETFQLLLERYNSAYTPKRLRGRLNRFRSAMLKRNWKKVCVNIKFSNFIGMLLHHGK